MKDKKQRSFTTKNHNYPVTDLIVSTTKEGKRYELFNSATLQQITEIDFEYKPQ